MPGINTLLNTTPLNQSPSTDEIDVSGYSGERFELITFTTDPAFYYPNANNNFTFFCEYTAPIGNVNLVFPDSPCAAFDSFEGYSGELAVIPELVTSDLYQFWEGSTAGADLTTFILLNDIDAYSGESGSASLITSSVLAPIAYSGENLSLSTITIPPRAELSGDFYAGERGDATLKPLQYADYIKSEGPSAYWKMDEQSGTSAIDYTGNNSPATYNLGPVLANASPVASKFAVYLDGINDTISGNPNVTSDNLTQELWVKPAAGATITLYTASNSGIQGTGSQRYAVWPYQNGTGSGGGISVGTNGIQVVAHGNSYLPILLSYQHPISTTEFTHVLVSWSDRTPTLYINGVAVATGYQARAPFKSQGLPSNGSYGYYKGYIQDVAIYPAALTAEQAREHYLAGIGLHFIPRFEPVPAYTGQYVDPIEFTTDPRLNFGDIDNFEGAVVDADLQANSILYPDAYAGEDSISDLTIYPSAGMGIFQAYSGERGDADLNTYSLISADARAGEVGTADLTINPFDQIDSDAYSGERGDIDLSTSISFSADGSTGESGDASLDIHPSIALSIPAITGEGIDPIALVTSNTFALTAYSGELNSIEFTIFPGVHLVLPFYSGERGDLTLSTTSLISATGYSDQYSTAELTVFYPTTLVPTAYSDQYSTVSLHTQDALEPRAYADQTADADLTIAPAILMSATAEAGESGIASILPGITFPSLAEDGARLFFDIDFVVNLGMLLPGSSGETAFVADMATEYNLPLYGYAGERSDADLGVEYALDIGGYSGERGSADLTLNLPDLLAGTAYSGESLASLTLSTRTLLPSIGYSGEGVLVVLADNPAAPLLLSGYSGESVSASVQTAIQLPIGRHYAGEWANVTGMGTEPNWYMVNGTHCVATLSTSVVISPVAYDGARGSVTYDTRPSEPLGVFHFRPGEWMSPGLEVLYSAKLGVIYRTSIMTQVDMRSATYFDLTTDECCGPRAETNNLNFIIERGQYPEEVGFGDRVSMDLVLSCQPRMGVSFPTGTVAELVDKSDYFEITFAHESNQIDLVWDADLRHRLCKGYFIPTGDWVVVEMQDILPEDCYADRFYGGEEFTCALSDDLVLRVESNSVGENLFIELGTNPPWFIEFRNGQTLSFDFPFEVKHTYRTGEIFSLSFYEQPVLMFDGSILDLEIQTEYGIRFLESGCFDNEFVYQNESGDAIPELFNPVPVEGEPYTHSIRAECF